MINVRGQKLTKLGNQPQAVYEFLCHGKAADGQRFSYDVTFDAYPDRPTKTDLKPNKQVPEDAVFPDQSMGSEQWQLLGHPRVTPMEHNGEKMGQHCSRCWFPSQMFKCPICYYDKLIAGMNPSGGTGTRCHREHFPHAHT